MSQESDMRESQLIAEARLEWSDLAYFAHNVLTLRKIGPASHLVQGPFDRVRVAAYLILGRDDLPVLANAIRKVFGEEAWPMPTRDSDEITQAARMHVELQPGQITAPAGTYSHWEPEANQAENIKSSGGNRREFL